MGTMQERKGTILLTGLGNPRLEVLRGRASAAPPTHPQHLGHAHLLTLCLRVSSCCRSGAVIISSISCSWASSAPVAWTEARMASTRWLFSSRRLPGETGRWSDGLVASPESPETARPKAGDLKDTRRGISREPHGSARQSTSSPQLPRFHFWRKKS